MLVIIMLEQRVVGVVGLDAAGSRIRMPSAKAPAAGLGMNQGTPGDNSGIEGSTAPPGDGHRGGPSAVELYQL
jgi:hypothetical protein